MKTIKLSSINPNPNNPRIIKDKKFDQLVESIKTFPQMMELRPIIVDENDITLGGNMRLKALEHLGYSEIPPNWIKKVSGLTEDQKREFVVKDNLSYGEWDIDSLIANWDTAQLDEWGVDVVPFVSAKDEVAKEEEFGEFTTKHKCPKCGYEY